MLQGISFRIFVHLSAKNGFLIIFQTPAIRSASDESPTPSRHEESHWLNGGKIPQRNTWQESSPLQNPWSTSRAWAAKAAAAKNASRVTLTISSTGAASVVSVAGLPQYSRAPIGVYWSTAAAPTLRGDTGVTAASSVRETA